MGMRVGYGGFGYEGIFMLAIMLLFFFIILWALVDVLIHEFSGYNKLIWIALIIVMPFLGSAIYLIIGRKQKIAKIPQG